MKPISLITVVVSALIIGCGAKSPESVADASDEEQTLATNEGKDPTEPGAGMVELEVLNLLEYPQGGVLVLLKEKENASRVVPMVVGDAEAGAIARRLSRQKFARPLTHDLLETILETFKVRVVKVEIDDLQDATFLARLFLLDSNNKVTKLDARPSDSIALAIGAGAPIFIHVSVLDRIGEPIEDWMPAEDQPEVPSEMGGEAMLL